jgi:aromatic-L-amino-acid decarboxylase
MRKEETLDPEDWNGMKQLAKRMAEDMISYQQNIRDKPILLPKQEETLAYFKQSAPEDPIGPEKTYQEFLDYFVKNKGSMLAHPRMWGGVTGQGTPLGALADMWSSGMNALVHSYDITSNLERQVHQWIKEMLEYPSEASAILGSGGSMANLIALNVARNKHAGYDINELGCNGKLTFYGSTELHASIERDLKVLGVGSKNLRLIPTDEKYKINIGLLKEKIDEDRNLGYTPVCVVGNSGSTNVGAIDDLDALASFCKSEDLWFHIDGAFGAWVKLSPKYRHMVKGQEKADSITLDLHKWMYMPYGIGCTLIRDEEAHYDTYNMNPAYVAHTDRILNDYTFEQSRSSRALKAWMSIKEHGVGKYRRQIEKNIEQAQYLGKLIEDSPDLELVAPVNLNVICFRFIIDGLSDEELNKINYKIFNAFIRDPKCAFLPSVVNGKTVFRVSNTNHRTKFEDMDFLVEWFVQHGKNIGDN